MADDEHQRATMKAITAPIPRQSTTKAEFRAHPDDGDVEPGQQVGAHEEVQP